MKRSEVDISLNHDVWQHFHSSSIQILFASALKARQNPHSFLIADNHRQPIAPHCYQGKFFSIYKVNIRLCTPFLTKPLCLINWGLEQFVAVDRLLPIDVIGFG
jgi:hypothetical protein